jgi:hypothetical protein
MHRYQGRAFEDRDMRLQHLFVCLIILEIYSCNSGGSNAQTSDTIKKTTSIDKRTSSFIKNDTVVYTYKKLKSYDKNCKPKNDCSYVNISFPIFQNLPQLNKTVIQAVLTYLNNEHGKPENLDVIFKEFSDDFFADIDSSESINPSTLELEITTAAQDSSFVILKFADEMSGGAHPNQNDGFINWNTKKDNIIGLEDILIDGYKTRLTKIAEKIFRKNENLTSSDSLENYFFKNGIFTLDGNFQITPKGLSFFYNNYEIKPYSEGPTTLLIPYLQIKSLLRPNTVVSQYIK